VIYQSVSSSAQSATTANAAPPIDEATAKALITKINHDGAIQTSFETLKAIKPQDHNFLTDIAKAIGDFIVWVVKLLEPLGPILPFLATLLILLIVGFILSPVVRLMLRQKFERFWPSRHRLRADAPWVPTQAAVSALLSEIDALAAKGEYDAAVHLLLYRTLADLNARKSNLVKPYFTAREILSHPLLPKTARDPFGEIVRWAELSFFADIAVGKAGFEACRAAYVAFLTAQGLRVDPAQRAGVGA
jgi:hypothetical protein